MSQANFNDFIIRRIVGKLNPKKVSKKKKKKKQVIKHQYFLKNGKKVSKSKIEKHLKGMYIPPAYDNVVINLDKNGKVWAIGEDDKGRKQYIYNKEYVKNRSKRVFKTLKKFGAKFDLIEKKVVKDLKSKNQKIKQIAHALTLMKDCNFRIGNEANVKKYNSYGVTTLQKKHVKSKKSGLTIDFIGKKGVRNVSTVQNKNMKKFIKKRLKSIKRKEPLFDQIRARDVNEYLQEFDEDLSSKKLRTFNANTILIENLLRTDFDLKPKKQLKKGINAVAFELHNTPSICKKSYLNPKLMEFFLNSPENFCEHFQSKSIPDAFTKFLNSNY